MRKEAGLVPRDIIKVGFQLKKEIEKWEDYIKQETNSKVLEGLKDGEKFDLEKEINLDGKKAKIGISKVKK